MLTYFLILTIPVSALALIYARWEYRKHGKLTPWGLLLLCLMFFMPNLVLEYATRYEMPGTWLDYVGIFVGLVGLTLCLISMYSFRSVPKVLCLDADELTLSGLYRWSRNPQYIGWILFLLGIALNDWSWWCLGALLVITVSIHLLILVEEEHLLRAFGEPYLDFCNKVPRYAAWRQIRI